MVGEPKPQGEINMKNHTLTAETENALRNYANGYCDAMANAIDNNEKLVIELRAVYDAGAIRYSRTKEIITADILYDYCLVVINDYWTGLIESIDNSLEKYDDLYIVIDGTGYLVPEAIVIIGESFESIKNEIERVLYKATNGAITKLPKAILISDTEKTTYEDYNASC